MATLYQLRIYNRSGVLRAVLTDFVYLSYVKEVNAAGLLEFQLRADHPAILELELDGQVEVWRANPALGLDWYTDFIGLFRYERRSADSDGRTSYVARCPGVLSLLGRAIVAYSSETANRSEFTSDPAETVVKTLVTRNATSSGTTGDGRARNVDLTQVTVEADGARGNVIDFACAWQDLLSSCQRVADIGDGDFDLVRTASPTQFQFKWFPGQLGTDRSATVVFSLAYGNMANPVLTRDWMKETTVAIVGGQGVSADRSVQVRTGSTYIAGYRSVEAFYDARRYTTTAGLQDTGDQELYAAQTRDELAFDVLQIPQTLYGLHYGLGDLVTGSYQGVSATKKIRKVSVSLSPDGSETINVEMTNV